MANKGNPNHAPAGAPGGTGGQFVSGPQSGGETEQEQQQAQAPVAKKTTTKGKKKVAFKKKAAPTLKSGDALAQMFAKLQDISQGINVPLLNSPEEVEQNIEKFFSKQVIGHLDRLYGKAGGWCSADQFHPKSNPNVDLNLFTCVFGKYRYKDNHAHLISQEDYNKMAADTTHYRKVYRGFTSEGEKRANIIKSYITPDINNIDIYGNGVYGTNVYTSTDYSYSYNSYAGRQDSKVLYCLVDRTANKIETGKLRTMRDRSFTRHYDYNTGKSIKPPLRISLENKIENHLIANGIEAERAKNMAKDFGETLERDESLLAILLGYDYQVSSSGQQRNILNLDKWYIAKRW